MKQIRSHCLVYVLIALMLITLFPHTVMAEQPQVSLEKAIQTVKQNLTIPAGYSEFNSQFNSSQTGQNWILNWSPPGNEGGRFNVSVDASTGEIISMDSWKPETGPQPQYKMPVVSKEEARIIGEKFLQHIIPNRISALKYTQSNSQVIPLSSYGPAAYSLTWERQVQGIPVSGDGAFVNVNMSDGKVINYNLNWTKTDMVSPAGIISAQDARQVFEKAGILQLQYLLASDENGLEQNPILVYRIYHNSNGYIDAVKGMPLELEKGQWLQGGGASYDKAISMTNAKQESAMPKPLTPEESNEVERTANLISQDEAAAAVKKWVDINNSLSLNQANLEKDWRNPDKRVWSLNWQSARSDSNPSYLWARIDAQTGAMISFNMDYESASRSSSTMSREAARKMAEQYIEQYEPRFAQVKLDANSNNYDVSPNNSYWRFNYLRVVNGITCPGNGIEVGVDAVNQRVNSYNLSWTDKEFPANQGILTKEKANQIYLQESPLTLCYCPLYMSEGLREVKLVYQPRSSSGQIDTGIIDAKTGARLHENGKPVSDQIRPYTFNDISGYFGEKEISLLGQAGIFGEYKDAFHPGENVKLVSLLRAMIGVQNGVWAIQNLTDEEVMKQARNQGWLRENLDPASSVNRELISRIVVRFLGIGYLAVLNNIYQVPYNDLGNKGADLQGCATLTWGLGIIKGSGSKFDAGHTISRGEAAVVLLRTLGAKNATSNR